MVSTILHRNRTVLPLYFGGRILSYNRLSSGIISPNSNGLSLICCSLISAPAYVVINLKKEIMKDRIRLIPSETLKLGMYYMKILIKTFVFPSFKDSVMKPTK